MKKILFLSMLFFAVTNYIFAQTGTVKINNHALVKTQTPRLNQEIKGYSVRIFFDNSQDARTGAIHAKNKFKELYPDVVINDEYTAPYFKVTVGKFLTNEEAIILWGNILPEFPNAFVVSTYLPISEFTDSYVIGHKTDLVENEMFSNIDEDEINNETEDETDL